MERDLVQVDSVFAVSVNEHDPFFKFEDINQKNTNSGNIQQNTQHSANTQRSVNTQRSAQTLHNIPAHHYCL